MKTFQSQQSNEFRSLFEESNQVELSYSMKIQISSRKQIQILSALKLSSAGTSECEALELDGFRFQFQMHKVQLWKSLTGHFKFFPEI